MTRRRVSLLALLVTVVVAGAAFVRWQSPIVSYLTHWKGSPARTWAYVPIQADDPPVLRLAVVGYIGDSGRRLGSTAAAIDRLAGDDPFDVLLLLGDNVYPAADPARLSDVVYKPFGPVLDRGTALLAILGNHDVLKGQGDAQMAALGMPDRWWSVERSGVLLVGLDSNRPDDPDQLAWLERTLRDTRAPWKIVALHHPPYSAGYQGSNEPARAAFTPLFERYGVQLVLSGHDHDYQRSHPIGGTTYVVTGAAAGTRRTGESEFTAVSFSWHSYLEVGACIRTGSSDGLSTRTTGWPTSGRCRGTERPPEGDLRPSRRRCPVPDAVVDALPGASHRRRTSMTGTRTQRCPRFGCEPLQPVRTADGTRLYCGACRRCWTQEYRYLIEVNRYACPGCDDRTRCRPI